MATFHYQTTDNTYLHHLFEITGLIEIRLSSLSSNEQ